MRLKSYLLMIFILSMVVFPFLLSKEPDRLSYAFINVKLVPMTSDIVLDHQTVIVKGSEITAIGPSDQVHVPDKAAIINGEGYYLMPGLADMHMHTRQDWDDPNSWPVSPLSLYLANGVTTVRDFGPSGNDITYPLHWRDEITAGQRTGPSIITSGKIFYKSPIKDAAGLVIDNHSQGFDFLKIYSYPSRDDVNLALEKADEIGFYSAGHIPYSMGLEDVLTAGLDEIAHVEELLYEFFEFDRDQILTPDNWLEVIISSVIQSYDLSDNYLPGFFQENDHKLNRLSELLVSSNVPVCTTMVVDDVVVMKNFQPDLFLSRQENNYFEDGYLESFLEGDEKHLNQCRGVQELCATKAEIDSWILQGLYEAGVMLLLGTDSGTGGMGIIPGFSIHDELGLLVEQGFSPYEALKTGTVNAGYVVEKMGGDGNFGTIDVGMRADLILVRENPLVDLTALRDLTGVMAAGRWYDQETLQELIEIK